MQQNMTISRWEAAVEERTGLRSRILAARNGLPADERQCRSSLIHENLWRLPEFARAGLLFFYVEFRSEVSTLPLIRRCLAAGREVAVPLTRTERRLEAYRLLDPDQDLRPGYCGIPEPDSRHLEPVAPGRIEMIILPGAVFDRRGGRLGYGGGYYDRFLADSAPNALRIGLAFEMQVVEQVPVLPHDQRLDFLVTETGVTRCQGSGVRG